MSAFTSAVLVPGTEIEVRTRYLDSWARGFEVASVERGRVTVRRRSDRVVLPVTIAREDVRSAQPGSAIPSRLAVG